MKPEYLIKKERVAIMMDFSESSILRGALSLALEQADYQGQIESLSRRDRRQVRKLQKSPNHRTLEIGHQAILCLSKVLNDFGTPANSGPKALNQARDMAHQMETFAADLMSQCVLYGELPEDFGESPTDQV